MSDAKPPSEKPTLDPNRTSREETATPAGELPEVGEQSVIIERDPSGRLGPGIKLHDLDDERKLPELHMGSERYEVLELIGRGGMGEVYLAYDQDIKNLLLPRTIEPSPLKQASRVLSA